MKIEGKVHCFFEQSGTFKNEFIKLGIPAEDYDIQNNFGETDHVIDLFAQIDAAFEGGASVFDKIEKSDLIIAFFPCIYFCENNAMYFKGVHNNLKTQSEYNKTKIIIQRAKDREYFYEKILELYGVVTKIGARLIIENPFSPFHFLVNNFPAEPAVIDKNRMERGDYFIKPTQYWFINCEPTRGFTYQNDKQQKILNKAARGKQAGLCSEERSLISPDYARNFICDFILGKYQPEISGESLFGSEYMSELIGGTA